MILKSDKILDLLDALNMTIDKFANVIGVISDDAYKMLRGQAVGPYAARQFINYLRADIAQHYIDWAAMGIQNPLHPAPKVNITVNVHIHTDTQGEKA